MTEVTRGSHYRARWTCSRLGCGFEWTTMVVHRTSHKSGCPACAAVVYSRATAEYNLTVWCDGNAPRGEQLMLGWNDRRAMTAVTRASQSKALWKCSRGGCGRVWTAAVASRTHSG
jgi:hypothetical protein